MKLKNLIEQYIDYRKSLGEKFLTNATYLRAFYNNQKKDLCICDADQESVNKFLYGDSKVTSVWFIKHTALSGFYEYAINREHTKSSPMPKILPKRPPAFIPYIYTKKELKLLLDTALTYQIVKSHIVPYVVRTILLLIYSAGLRLSEVLKLTMGDVDLSESVIIIRETKFYKTRLIPFNQQLLEVINEYLDWRKKVTTSQQYDGDAPLFVSLKNKPINPKAPIF